MSTKDQNNSGSAYSARAWLENHHSIKSKLRQDLVPSLNIKAGDTVLDFGCGTGTWALLLADQVGHSGTVLGIDQDADAILAANMKRESYHDPDRIEFYHWDLQRVEGKKFDSIIAFNTLSYFGDCYGVFDSLASLLKPNGRIIIKDSDLGSDFFWPIDQDLYHRILKDESESDKNYIFGEYNPFFSRRIPELLLKSNLELYSTQVQTHSYFGNVEDRVRRYIRENGRMIGSLATSKEDKIRWNSIFDDLSDDCIFNSDGFFYTVSEFIFYARIPDKP